MSKSVDRLKHYTCSVERDKKNLKQDIESILSDLSFESNLRIKLKSISNIYLNVILKTDGITPRDYKDELERLIDYMKSQDYKFNYFDNYDKYYLNWVFDYDKLFDIPNTKKYKIDKLMIQFDNQNWEREDKQIKAFNK